MILSRNCYLKSNSKKYQYKSYGSCALHFAYRSMKAKVQRAEPQSYWQYVEISRDGVLKLVQTT